MALPPRFKVSAPASTASGCGATTMPRIVSLPHGSCSPIRAQRRRGRYRIARNPLSVRALLVYIAAREGPMRRAGLWLMAAMLALASPGASAGAPERVAAAIVFAVDVSGSVNTERYEL